MLLCPRLIFFSKARFLESGHKWVIRILQRIGMKEEEEEGTINWSERNWCVVLCQVAARRRRCEL